MKVYSNVPHCPGKVSKTLDKLIQIMAIGLSLGLAVKLNNGDDNKEIPVSTDGAKINYLLNILVKVSDVKMARDQRYTNKTMF